MANSSSWIHFNSPTQTSQFIDTAFELHSDLISKLSRDDVPYFTDYWLNRFNLCDAWVQLEHQLPVALVTKPKVKDTHSERWQYNTLVLSPSYSGSFDLPFETATPVAFISPHREHSHVDKQNFAVSIFQRGFARTTKELPPVQLISGVKFEPVAADNLERVCALLDCDYYWDGQPADYIQGVKTEIARSVKLKSGWCYTATRDSLPIAVVSYLSLQAPLLGTASAVVGDLFVLPEERSKGIASNLQTFAYHQFQSAGINWILGNIDPANQASTRQALRVGRSPIYDVLVLHPRRE